MYPEEKIENYWRFYNFIFSTCTEFIALLIVYYICTWLTKYPRENNYLLFIEIFFLPFAFEHSPFSHIREKWNKTIQENIIIEYYIYMLYIFACDKQKKKWKKLNICYV